MASPSELGFKKRIANSKVLPEFFAELETQEFPAEIVKANYPEAVQRWEQLGCTQSVPWIWVMFAELCLVSFLSPTAVLRPMPSITVYAVLWFFFVHPGATSTSNLLRLYGDALDTIEHRARTDRQRRREEWKVQHGAKGGGKGAPNPYVGDLSMTVSAGSLEGEGRMMAQPQNLGRSVGFMSEGKRFFTWLQSEGSINESIATELYERAKWKRTTIHEDRSFEMSYPFFAACGALHVPDVASLFLDGDPLGIRGRVSFFYSRPAFNLARELRAANQVINANGCLVEEVATFFWPCHTTHDPVWSGVDRFTQQKNYPFRVYSLGADAQRIFDEHFDHHVVSQREQHLVDQEKAKFHGKAKTKHLRLALALHLFEETRMQHTSETWASQLVTKHLVVAEKLGEYLDMVTERMAQLFARINSDGKAAPSVPAEVKLSARQQLLQTLHGDFTFFTTLPRDKQGFFWKLGQMFLQSTAVWVENAAFGRQQGVKALLESLGDIGQHGLARVACLLHHLCMGAIVQGTNTHGTPIFYIVKRHLDANEACFALLSNVLVEFEVPLHSYKSFPAQAVLQHRPAKAASLPTFAAIDEEAVRGYIAIIREWRSQVHAGAGARAAPPAVAPRSLN